MLVGTLLGLSLAHATTLVVVTDQPKAQKAQEVAALFRTVAPFSKMKDLKIKVIQTSPSKLGCEATPFTEGDIVSSETSEDLIARTEWRERSTRASLPPSCNNKDGPISRLISCDTPQARAYLTALQKTEKAAEIVVVKEDARYGGSGGARPVITTGSPASMAVHELMHQLGFGDEYAYTNACEADIYCTPGASDDKSPSGYGALPGTSFNVAAFNSRTNYTSNADVRKFHGAQIPWFSFIDASTDLAPKGQLGTTPKAGQIGLYRTSVCDLGTARRDTWLSTSEPTIMRTLSTTFIPKDYWPTIAKSLGTHIAP